MTSKVSVIGYVTRAKLRATFDHSYGLLDRGLPQKKKMPRNLSTCSTSSKPSNSRMPNTSSKASTKNKRKLANKGIGAHKARN